MTCRQLPCIFVLNDKTSYTQIPNSRNVTKNTVFERCARLVASLSDTPAPAGFALIAISSFSILSFAGDTAIKTTIAITMNAGSIIDDDEKAFSNSLKLSSSALNINNNSVRLLRTSLCRTCHLSYQPLTITIMTFKYVRYLLT